MFCGKIILISIVPFLYYCELYSYSYLLVFMVFYRCAITPAYWHICIGFPSVCSELILQTANLICSLFKRSFLLIQNRFLTILEESNSSLLRKTSINYNLSKTLLECMKVQVTIRHFHF